MTYVIIRYIHYSLYYKVIIPDALYYYEVYAIIPYPYSPWLFISQHHSCSESTCFV